MGSSLKIIFLLLAIFRPLAATARIYDMFRADSPKGAFCDAIGGACAADMDLENAFFQNPATLATGKADWNFDGDISAKSNLEPGMARDNTITETITNGGAGYTNGNWGLGVSGSRQQTKLEGTLTIFDDNEFPLRTKMTSNAKLQQASVPLAFLVTEKLSIGITPMLIFHNQEFSIPGSDDGANNSTVSKGFGLTLGTLYRDNPRFRIGSWFKIPTTLYEHADFTTSVSSTQVHYVEDFALRFPWVWSLGTAFENSSGYTFFLENDIIGPTRDGHLLSYDTLSAAVGDKDLVVKGKNIVPQPHWGMRKALSQKLTLHLGGYYETSRWVGNPGRLHGSGGMSFNIKDWVEIIGGFDIANKFTHIFFTFR